MSEDARLLRRYVEDRSQAAFAELVGRHLGLVYSSALRQVGGDAHLARDVAQTVFTDLARKAAPLAGRPSLTGWLYTSTRYAAAKAVRAERRRRAREQEAHAMQDLTRDPTPPLDWDRLHPVLDDAMHALRERDREAVLLRFFENRDFADIGARTGLTENAARMRVDRALGKLQALLARRGVTSTAAALAGALPTHAIVAAPAGLAPTIAVGALTGASAGGGLALLALMSTAKFHLGVAGAIAAASTATFFLQYRSSTQLEAEIAALQAATAPLSELRERQQTPAGDRTDLARLQADAAEFERLQRESQALRAKLEAARNAQRSPVAPAPARTVAAHTGPVLPLAEVDVRPAPMRQSPPTYPATLLAFGINGQATMTFVVDTEGNVSDIQPTKSTHSAFEAAATEALQQWKFQPGRKNGLAVNTRVTVPIVFKLRPEGADWF